MQKILGTILAVLVFSSFSGLSAKCFGFSKNKDFKVCVNGNNNAARKKAQSICKAKSGKDCGNITGYTGSCNASGSTKCLDESGTEKKKLKVN
ncbi:MAG: hypothetical protein KDK36_15645 [Leptospiraceae bacterium]|nr:hypothetical protein [Leptospiraceae bacterium]